MFPPPLRAGWKQNADHAKAGRSEVNVFLNFAIVFVGPPTSESHQKKKKKFNEFVYHA